MGMGREEKSDKEAKYTDSDLDQLDNIGPNTKNANVPVPGSSINGRARRNLKAVRYEEDFIVVDDSMDSDEDYDDEPSDASSECEDGHDHISDREEDTPHDTGPINYEKDMLDEDRPTNSDEDMLDGAPGTTNHQADIVEDAGTTDDESVVEDIRTRHSRRRAKPCVRCKKRKIRCARTRGRDDCDPCRVAHQDCAWKLDQMKGVKNVDKNVTGL